MVEWIALGALVVAAYGAALSTIVHRRQQRLLHPRLELGLAVEHVVQRDYDQTVIEFEGDVVRLDITNPGPRPVQITGGRFKLDDGSTLEIARLPVGRPLAETETWPVSLGRGGGHGDAPRHVVGAEVDTTTAGTFRVRAGAAVKSLKVSRQGA